MLLLSQKFLCLLELTRGTWDKSQMYDVQNFSFFNQTEDWWSSGSSWSRWSIKKEEWTYVQSLESERHSPVVTCMLTFLTMHLFTYCLQLSLIEICEKKRVLLTKMTSFLVTPGKFWFVRSSVSKRLERRDVVPTPSEVEGMRGRNSRAVPFLSCPEWASQTFLPPSSSAHVSSPSPSRSFPFEFSIQVAPMQF